MMDRALKCIGEDDGILHRSVETVAASAGWLKDATTNTPPARPARMAFIMMRSRMHLKAAALCEDSPIFGDGETDEASDWRKIRGVIVYIISETTCWRCVGWPLIKYILEIKQQGNTAE